MEELLAFEEGNLAVREDLGTGLLSALLGEWRLLYTSSNAMEYNQVCDVGSMIGGSLVMYAPATFAM